MRSLRVWVSSAFALLLVLAPLPQFLSQPRAHAAGLTRAQIVGYARTRGCMYSGLVTPGFVHVTPAVFTDTVNMIARSECVFLYRSLETWNQPPDFPVIAGKIDAIKAAVPNRPLIHTMMIAESINPFYGDTQYRNDYDGSYFKFSEMCGDEPPAGQNWCVPSLKKPEYLRYVTYIMKRGIDIGIQSFMFGNVQNQEDFYSVTPNAYSIPALMPGIRAYAQERGMEIVVGGQIGGSFSLASPHREFVQTFDYLDMPLYQGLDGSLGTAACQTRPAPLTCSSITWWEDAAHIDAAKLILVALDWFSNTGDDMNVFAGITSAQRAALLQTAYQRFFSHASGKLGFVMPMHALLQNTGGCTGPGPYLYSSSNTYSCKDEGMINQIIRQYNGSLLVNDAVCASHTIPATMTVNATSSVTLTFRNTGTKPWTSGGGKYSISLSPWPTPSPSLMPAIFPIPQDVPLGGTLTRTFTLTAPGTAGAYAGKYQIVENGIGWFGETCGPVTVSVAAASAPVNDASFVSQSVPSSMITGRSYTVSITFRNTGTKLWDKIGSVGDYVSSYRIKSQNPPDNTTWGTGFVSIPRAPIGPNETATFSFAVVAPSSPGMYHFQWRMNQGGVGWFGPTTPNVAVAVAAASSSAPLPVIVSFRATPPALVSGESARLIWSTLSASSCEASGDWSGARGSAGNLEIRPTATASYRLTCRNAAGASVSADVTVTVAPQSAPTSTPLSLLPRIITFRADPATIIGGSATRVRWEAVSAASCTAQEGWQGTKGFSGSEQVMPDRTTSYRLVCRNSAGTETAARITVTVTPSSSTPNVPNVPPPVVQRPAGTASGTVDLFALLQHQQIEDVATTSQRPGPSFRISVVWIAGIAIFVLIGAGLVLLR